jgi:hypothetical protein
MASPSLPPAGVPSSSNTKYGLAALLLLVPVCGIVAWKMKADQTTTTTIPSVGVPTVLPPITRRIDDDMPPPDPVVIKSTPTGTAVAGTNGGSVPNGCEKSCRGTAGDDLVGALAQRGRMARRCYEKELANDPKLTVRMTMNVRVGTNGSVCSASVASSDNPGIGACVANIYRNAAFPAAKGGCAEVNVPLNFVPGK